MLHTTNALIYSQDDSVATETQGEERNSRKTFGKRRKAKSATFEKTQYMHPMLTRGKLKTTVQFH